MSPPTPLAPGTLNWALILFLGIVWGAAFMGIATALDGYGPWTVTAGRVLIGAAVLASVGTLMDQPPWHLGGRRAASFATIIGILAIAAPFALLSFGLQQVPSAFAGVAMGAVPLLVLPLVAIFSPEEGIGPRRIAGIALGFVGSVLLVGEGAFEPGGATDFAGRIACLAAALCYAVGSVLTRRAPPMPPIAFAGATLAVAAALLVPVALIVEGMPRDFPALPTLGLLYIAIGPTALASVIRVRVITTAGSMFMSLTSYMVPVWSVIFGITMMDEALPRDLFLALGLILAGIALSQWRAFAGLLRRR